MCAVGHSGEDDAYMEQTPVEPDQRAAGKQKAAGLKDPVGPGVVL